MFVISSFAFVEQKQAGCYEMYHFASHKAVSLCLKVQLPLGESVSVGRCPSRSRSCG
jgi:hypothetical protein